MASLVEKIKSAMSAVRGENVIDFDEVNARIACLENDLKTLLKIREKLIDELDKLNFVLTTFRDEAREAIVKKQPALVKIKK